MINISKNTIAVGKYIVSPSSQLTEAGTYASSVSIRSGAGRATHDRVFRFKARFDTREGANAYAIEQGLQWLERSSTQRLH